MPKQDLVKFYYVYTTLKHSLTLKTLPQFAKVGQLFLLETIFYFAIFLWHEFLGLLLATIFGCLSTALLMISWIVERIEKSKVPHWYYLVMLISILSPLLVTIFFTVLGGISIN